MTRTARITLTIGGSLAGLLVLMVLLGHLVGGQAPDYTVTSQDTSGQQRTITIEVGSDEDLRAVFDDVVAGLDDEAGYYVRINCTTGGTGSADNRLANGRYALGGDAELVTGLRDGQTEFDTVDNASCPDEPPLSPAERSSIRAEAGLPPDPDEDTAAAYIADLEVIDPNIVHGKDEKAIDRGLNQCSSVANGHDETELVRITNERFTSPEHPEGFGENIAAQILDTVRTHLC
ncbi:hypothetical protein [Saccharomonospora iraqiensis]|uniref:hypothetical protein n=1 Tax=Saccharomonospora iraqiensis TaxID=52698 RepID=UPI00041EAA28|nr:hypothetical protein [Saccharomonospora iraqiensis]